MTMTNQSGDQRGPAAEEADRERARREADGDAYVAWVYARTLWTSGSVTRAQVAVQEARYNVETDSPHFAEWRRFIRLNMSLSGMLGRLTETPP